MSRQENNATKTQVNGSDLTFVYGLVSKQGHIDSGSGNFDVVNDQKSGIYTVIFDSNFQARPAVVATVAREISDPTDQSNGKNVTVNNIEADRFQLIIQDTTGSRQDHAFSFIATGS